MPLYKKVNINRYSQLLVWKVTEPLGELQTGVLLNPMNIVRIAGMKSEMHQRAFLSVRKLLAEAGYTDFDLTYDSFGKPHLNNQKHISITHSHHFAAIIISDDIVGIDIELAREKISRIAPKFASSEMTYLDAASLEYIPMLAVIWGVKEAIFKIRNESGISFNEHITVLPFKMEDRITTGKLDFNGNELLFDVTFDSFEGFVLVYAFAAK